MTSTLPARPTIQELKDFLREKGRALSGNKSELWERIVSLGVDPLSLVPPAVTGQQTTQAAFTASSGTGVNLSRHSGANVTISRSKSLHVWRRVPLPNGRIIEKEDSVKACGNFIDSAKNIQKNINNLVAPLRGLYPGVDDDVLLFAYLIDQFAGIVLRKTNQELVRRGLIAMDGEELGVFIAHFIRCNCIVLSNEMKWDMVTEGKSEEFRLRRFLEIAHNFLCLSPSSKLGEDTWVDPLKRQEEINTVEKSINNTLQELVKSSILTLDDDVLLNKSKEATHEKAGHIIHNDRKGDGVSINVCSEIHFSLTAGFSTTTRGGGDQLVKVRNTIGINAGHKLFCDRGYTNLSAVKLNNASHVGTFGILNEKFKKDQGFTHVHSDSEDFECSVPAELSVECFPGVGPHFKVARLASGEYNICGVQNVTGTPRIVSYLAAGMFEESNFADFVRIPKSIPRKDRSETLYFAAKKGDETAMRIENGLQEKCMVFSLVQLDAAWWLGRIFRVSGSQSARWYRRVIELDGKEYGFLRVLTRTEARSYASAHSQPSASSLRSVSEQPSATSSHPVSTEPSATSPQQPVSAGPSATAPQLISAGSSATSLQPMFQPTQNEQIVSDPTLVLGSVINSIDDDDDCGGDDTALDEDNDDENVDYAEDENALDSFPFNLVVVTQENVDDNDDVPSINQLAPPGASLPNTAPVGSPTITEALSSVPIATLTANGPVANPLSMAPSVPVTNSTTAVTTTALEANQSGPTVESHASTVFGIEPVALGVFFDKFVKASFVPSNFNENDATLRGKLTEDHSVSFVASIFDEKKVYSLGVVHRKDITWAVASPDGIGLYKGEITVIEAKCSLNYIPAMNFSASAVTVVEAGSDEYFKLVPNEYCCQLLHEAVVLCVRQIMLVLSNAIGISRLVLVRFPPDVLLEYERYLKSEVYKASFEWFENNVLNEVISDEQFAAMIPSWATTSSKRILKTQLVLMRKVYVYRKRVGRPIEPTKLFREFPTDAYNFGKGGTDTECKQVVRATKGNTFNVPFRQKYSHRMIYFPSISAVRGTDVAREVNRVDPGKITLRRFRQMLSSKSLNDTLYEFALKLRKSGIVLGSLYQGRPVRLSSQPRTPIVETINEVTAADPVAMLTYLRDRAKRANREVNNHDFLIGTRIPLAAYSYSPDTPNSLIYNNSHITRCRQLTAIFDQKPNSNAQRPTRLDYWLTVGVSFRASIVIAHIRADVDNEALKSSKLSCLWCGKRTTSVTRCILCGENLCGSECWEAFHSFSQNSQDEEETEEAPLEVLIENRPFKIVCQTPAPKTKKLKPAQAQES